jgi:hypothetical protein
MRKIFVLVSLSLVSLACAFGVFTFKKGIVKNHTENTGAVNKEKRAEVLNKNTSQTEKNWTIHHDKTHGFSVQYPENWTMHSGKEITAQNLVATLTSPETKKRIDDVLKNGKIYAPYADIHFYVYKTDSYLEEYIDDQISKSGFNFILDMQPVSFSGLPAYKVIEGGAGKYFAIYIQGVGKLYKIFFENRETEGDLTATEKKILTSIEILN